MDSTEIVHASYGWLRDPFDGNDHPYQASNTSFPKEVNLLQQDGSYCHPVFDQGSSSSCVANAAAAVFSFELKKAIHDKKVTKAVIDPSRMFIYYNARTAMWDAKNTDEKAAAQEAVQDHGTYPRFALKSLEKFGVCPEADWPFDKTNFSIAPSDVAIKDALGYRISKYEKLDVNRPHHHDNGAVYSEQVMKQDGETLLKNLRLCLAEHHPVLFGLWSAAGWKWSPTHGPHNLPKLDKDFPATSAAEFAKLKKLMDDTAKAARDKDPNAIILPSLDYKAILVSGHALTALGYDDKEELVLCQNSFGNPGPADEPDKAPFFWMPYSWILDFNLTDDFWMIRLV